MFSINLHGLFNDKREEWYYLTNSWRDIGVYNSTKGIRLKMNVIVWMDSETAYFDVVIQHISLYAMVDSTTKNVNMNVNTMNEIF